MAVIQTEADLDGMIRYYTGKPFAFDVETLGDDRIDPLVADVAWISFATRGRSDVIPVGHPNGGLIYERPVLSMKGKERAARGVAREDMNPRYDFLKTMEREFGDPPVQLKRGLVFRRLEPLFFSDSLKVGHNIKFDLHAVSKYYGGVHPEGPYYDTMIASWVQDVSLRGRLDLAACVKRELDEVLVKGVGEDIRNHTFDDVAEYSLKDAEATWKLMEALQRRFTERLAWVFGLEMQVLRPVLEMEAAGVLIDEDRLREIGGWLQGEMTRMESTLYQIAGRKFNLNSNRDKQQILYTPKKKGGLGLRPWKATPAASKKPDGTLTVLDWSVDHETLTRYEHVPFVSTLLEHTATTKLYGTYVKSYVGEPSVNGSKPKTERKLRDGRIHAQFVQNGAESGRFSSRNPNLQNIPARTENGKKLREIFIADPGHTLIVADYSQVEPRIIASLSGDKTMLATYRDGGDVYLAVAERMEVKRDAGKELVLSIAYGIGPSRIANRIGCSPQEARDLMDYFASKFSAIPTYKRKVIARARRDKFSETITGRRRPFPYITRGTEYEQSSFERQAFNHVIQGSAADIMKIALVNMHYALPAEARMLMTVHDEVVVQVPDEYADEVAQVVKDEMEGARPSIITVPLVADVSRGHSWAEAKS